MKKILGPIKIVLKNYNVSSQYKKVDENAFIFLILEIE